MNQKTITRLSSAVLLLLATFAATAQDYILTQTNEVISAKIISIHNGNLYFRIREGRDTTLYLIKRENVKAIGFAEDKINEMKNAEFVEEMYKTANPDNKAYIYPDKAKLITALLDSLTRDQVRFKIGMSDDTNTYFINKEEISQITFNQIAESSESNNFKGMSDYEIMVRGESDAREFYDGYMPAQIGSFAAGLAWWVYFLPVAVPIAAALTPPNPSTFTYPNDKISSNPIYKRAYAEKAHKMKAGKVWIAFGAGAATSTVLIFYLFLIVLSHA